MLEKYESTTGMRNSISNFSYLLLLFYYLSHSVFLSLLIYIPLHLFLSLSIYFSSSLSISLPLYLFISLSIYFSPSLFLFLPCPILFLCIYLTLFVSLPLFIFPSLTLYISLPHFSHFSSIHSFHFSPSLILSLAISFPSPPITLFVFTYFNVYLSHFSPCFLPSCYLSLAHSISYLL